MVEYLLGCDPDLRVARGGQGRTPVMEACVSGHAQCTLYLLNQCTPEELHDEDDTHENLTCLACRGFLDDADILGELFQRGVPLAGRTFQVSVMLFVADCPPRYALLFLFSSLF